jgi:hypothetical protein
VGVRKAGKAMEAVIWLRGRRGDGGACGGALRKGLTVAEKRRLECWVLLVGVWSVVLRCRAIVETTLLLLLAARDCVGDLGSD